MRINELRRDANEDARMLFVTDDVTTTMEETRDVWMRLHPTTRAAETPRCARRPTPSRVCAQTIQRMSGALVYLGVQAPKSSSGRRQRERGRASDGSGRPQR